MNDLGNAINSWVEDISVQSEAVRGSIIVWWNCPAESIQVNHLIVIIELQNVSDGIDGVEILISLGIEVVERFRGVGRTI